MELLMKEIVILPKDHLKGYLIIHFFEILFLILHFFFFLFGFLIVIEKVY